MKSNPIDIVWARIRAAAGEEFYQIRGKVFRYEVQGTAVMPEGVNQNIPRSQFEEALELVPLKTTVPVQHLRGPSYIYAILMDLRIRGSDEWGATNRQRGEYE